MLIHRSEDPREAAEARTAILANGRLSFAARGLLLWLLEHGPEWDVNAEKITAIRKEERGTRGERIAAVRALFRELHDAGHMTRKVRSGGRVGTVLEVFDVPVRRENPVPVDDPKHPAERRGEVVYIVGEPGSSVVKIGMTSNIKKRLKGIQTHSPAQLEVLWTHQGGAELEEALHDRYHSRRLQGEWFDFGRSNPVRLVEKFVRRLDDEWYEECERQLKEHGRIVDAPFPLPSSL